MIYVVKCTVCLTRNRNRPFFNNFTNNEDIATKFEADYRQIPLHFSHNERTPVQIPLQYLIGVRIIKEMPGSVASGTHSISLFIQEVFLTQRTYFCSNFVTIPSLVLELLKKCQVR